MWGELKASITPSNKRIVYCNNFVKVQGSIKKSNRERLLKTVKSHYLEVLELLVKNFGCHQTL